MEGLENELEKGDVVRIEFSSIEGRTQWREVYSDNIVGPWEETLVETDDQRGFIKLKKELEAKYGKDALSEN